MRKMSRVLAVATGVALLSTACGGDSGEPASGGSEEVSPSESESASGPPERGDADLVVWTDDLKIDAIRQIADGFAEDNGITVDVQAVTDTQGNFITANTAGNGPDVVVGAHDWIGNMVQNGAIDPLQLTSEQLNTYDPVAVEAVTYQEQLYGLPYGIEALVLYRNADIVPDAPATLDDAFAAGQAAVAAGQAQSAFNLPVGDLGDAYHMQPLYTSLGGYVFGKTPEGDYDPADLGVGQPGSIAAAQRIFELGEGGQKVLSRSVSGDNSIALFADGQAPFLLSGPWAVPDLDKAGINYQVQPVPGFAGAAPAQAFAGVQAFFVASKGQNKAFAQEFVANAVNTEEAMRIMYEGAALPPALTSLQEAEVANNPNLQAFLDAARAGDPMPAIPQMAAVFEPLGKAYAAIVGGADPAATMQQTGQTISDSIS